MGFLEIHFLIVFSSTTNPLPFGITPWKHLFKFADSLSALETFINDVNEELICFTTLLYLSNKFSVFDKPN